MSFHNVSFPLALARGASGGPERRTDITTLASGQEERNAVWSQGRRRYDVGTAITSLDDLHRLISFFEARNGRLHAFRFRDITDCKSCLPSRTPSTTDQRIGTGNGTQTIFFLSRTYADSAGTTTRPIRAPVPGSVVIAINSTPVTPAAIDHTTGQITLPTAPATGAAITAGYVFDTIVRFDTDHLDATQDAFTSARVVSVPLVEVL